MQKYELAVILEGKTTPAKKKNIQAAIEKMVATFKGKVGSVNDWGVRDLAYKIKKSESGIYILFNLELESEAAKSINQKVKLEAGILRHLLIRVK